MHIHDHIHKWCKNFQLKQAVIYLFRCCLMVFGRDHIPINHEATVLKQETFLCAVGTKHLVLKSISYSGQDQRKTV